MRANLVISLVAATLGFAARGQAQADSVRADSTRAQPPAPPRQAPPDTALVQGGVYNRPFITSVGRTSIGGYAEANTNYFVEDGVGDGFSMELRRFNIFLFAPVGRRLRFLSELEFEHGTQEIAIETAQLDFQVDPALVLRAGVLLKRLKLLRAHALAIVGQNVLQLRHGHPALALSVEAAQCLFQFA